MSEPGIDELRTRTRAGDVDAATRLARRMLAGQGVPQAPAEAVALLESAAGKGGAEAALQLSVCAAWGVGQPRNVAAALDHLARAAECGSLPAQRELQVLARTAAGGDWHGVRQRIDVSGLTAAPPARVISERPRILVLERFAAADECANLIELGRPALTRALVYRGSASARAADSRTNTETGFTIFRANVLLNLVRERMASALQVSTRFFEVTKLLHYEPGEQFALHADFLQTNTPEMAREVELRGQRSITFLTYLNDDYVGGETDFPRLALRHKGKTGDALVFSNLDANGSPDYGTVHAGLAPVTGEKWLLSQWVRTKPVG